MATPTHTIDKTKREILLSKQKNLQWHSNNKKITPLKHKSFTNTETNLQTSTNTTNLLISQKNYNSKLKFLFQTTQHKYIAINISYSHSKQSQLLNNSLKKKKKKTKEIILIKRENFDLYLLWRFFVNALIFIRCCSLAPLHIWFGGCGEEEES